MPRLFIAIPLPPAITGQLAATLPAPVAGMRLVRAESMHVTLHFIGEAEVADIVHAVEQVRFAPFDLEISGRGQFSRGAVLWAGVKLGPALLQLQQNLGDALAAHGIATEKRPYHPHVTLARCKPGVGRESIQRFLAAPPLPPLHVQVMAFALYLSTSMPGGPMYRIERHFPAVQA